MRIPALRSKIGDWTYYTSTLSFEKISLLVRKIDNELHQSETLRDQIQRSITDNYKNVKNYILNKEDRFFNSLVLAVYDGEPKWIEVELNYQEEYFYNVGFLEFNGQEKIFPVDGQHRVEGIKAALLDNPELGKEEISVILIAHKNDVLGMQRTRRLFTTLNRYAKPVKLNDIIALDEDDSVAITTRELLENHTLFSKKRINNAEQKAIPENDKNAFTSLITLYECNLELYKRFLKITYNQNPTKLFLLEKQRYRPNDILLASFLSFSNGFWNDFIDNYSLLNTFLQTEIESAKEYRNNINGGNLLFRPVSLLPFVQTVIDINLRTGKSYRDIFIQFNDVNLQIDQKPWQMVLWNPVEKTMIMGNKATVKLLLLYLFDESLLSGNELKKLKERYAVVTNQIDNIDDCLMGIK